MGVRKGVYYWLRQVRPAPHLQAKTSEFLLPSEIGYMDHNILSNILWSSVRLTTCSATAICYSRNEVVEIRHHRAYAKEFF